MPVPWLPLAISAGSAAIGGLGQMFGGGGGYGSPYEQQWYKDLGSAPQDWSKYYGMALGRLQEDWEPQMGGWAQKMVQQGLWGSGPEKEVFGRLAQGYGRAQADTIAQIARQQMLMAHQRQMQRAQMAQQWGMGSQQSQQDWGQNWGQLFGQVGSSIPWYLALAGQGGGGGG